MKWFHKVWSFSIVLIMTSCVSQQSSSVAPPSIQPLTASATAQSMASVSSATAMPQIQTAGGSRSSRLVWVVAEGGRCTYGVCRSEFSIENDGRYTTQDGSSVKSTATLTASELEALKNLIQSTNFPQLAATPFVGDCPTAYDGQEITYTINTPQGIQMFASCRVQIDPEQPLIKLIDSLWHAPGSR